MQPSNTINFPPPWFDLIASNSDLGATASGLIEAVEARICHDEHQGAKVFPLAEMRYRALEMCSPAATKVIVIGQDPYHGLVKLPDGSVVPEATGLSFSIPQGARLPPSLRNIFKELVTDLNVTTPLHGDLTHWAKQGVLLLNTVLSVEMDQPKSHEKMGWQTITAAIIQALSRSKPGLVFILWGNSAKALRLHIADNAHTIIESSHPSPIGGSCNKGFFGSKPFSRANQALSQQGCQQIVWCEAAGYGFTD